VDAFPAGLSVRGRQVVRQELGHAGDGVGRYTRQDVLEPGEGIDPGPLARGHEAAQHSCRSATAIAAEKRPVVAADCYPADGTLGSVVVDLEIAVFAITGERGPVIQAVAELDHTAQTNSPITKPTGTRARRPPPVPLCIRNSIKAGVGSPAQIVTFAICNSVRPSRRPTWTRATDTFWQQTLGRLRASGKRIWSERVGRCPAHNRQKRNRPGDYHLKWTTLRGQTNVQFQFRPGLITKRAI
jgi:hypothetical protein